MELWPDLLNDGARAKSESNVANWSDFDAGCRSYFDQTHDKIYAIRNERGEYSVADKGTDEERVTADRAMAGCRKQECPTLHAILKARKEQINGYLTDKRRNLRECVAKLKAGQGKGSTKSPNRGFAEWFGEFVEEGRAKVKTVGSKAGYDAEKLKQVAEWLELSGKLGIN